MVICKLFCLFVRLMLVVVTLQCKISLFLLNQYIFLNIFCIDSHFAISYIFLSVIYYLKIFSNIFYVNFKMFCPYVQLWKIKLILNFNTFLSCHCKGCHKQPGITPILSYGSQLLQIPAFHRKTAFTVDIITRIPELPCHLEIINKNLDYSSRGKKQSINMSQGQGQEQKHHKHHTTRTSQSLTRELLHYHRKALKALTSIKSNDKGCLISQCALPLLYSITCSRYFVLNIKTTGMHF